MTILQTIALLFLLTSIGGYLNHHFLKLPLNIGLLLFSSVFSLGLIFLAHLNLINTAKINNFVNKIDFEGLVLHGLLCLLLFAGSLQVDVSKLKQYRWAIGVFSTLGVLIAAFATAAIIHYVLVFLKLNLPFSYCLLFGSLIAPTDAVAVLAILNKQTKDEGLKAKVTGEALFNDGMGVVLFLTVLTYTFTKHSTQFSYKEVSLEFFKELFGGFLIGGGLGILTTYMIKTIEQYEIEIMMTLALALGSYSLAEIWHVSAPIAAVVAGLIIGNTAKQNAMSEATRHRVDVFFQLIDDILNAVLFVLIGLKIISIALNLSIILISILAVFAVLSGRFISLCICGALLIKNKFNFKKLPFIMTWGGLRGSISIALALSLPVFPYKETLLSMTYLVVIFSIIVQGTTLGKVIDLFEKKEKKNHEPQDE